MLIILTLQLSLQLGRVLTGSSAALEPEQFLQMMAEMSSRLEERRAEEGLVGHYNSARCSTTYQEVCEAAQPTYGAPAAPAYGAPAAPACKQVKQEADTSIKKNILKLFKNLTTTKFSRNNATNSNSVDNSLRCGNPNKETD